MGLKASEVVTGPTDDASKVNLSRAIFSNQEASGNISADGIKSQTPQLRERKMPISNI